MESVVNAFNHAKRQYDRSIESADDVATVAVTARKELDGIRSVSLKGLKAYSVFETEVANAKGDLETRRSRPFLPSLMLSASDLSDEWSKIPNCIDTASCRLTITEDAATKLLYTTIMSFAACYDLWKPKSRKTPGTYFEVVLGTILKLIAPHAKRGKHIALPSGASIEDRPMDEIVAADEGMALDSSEMGDDELQDSRGSVSTDIVFEFEGESPRGIVIPAKITTRERIVQPFAHQRILDSAFGEGRYVSLLACVSETQRDDKLDRVNDICVPGTIALFQQHLSKLGGIYYLDPPQRYLQLEAEGLLNVRPVGALVTNDFGRFVTQLRTGQADQRPSPV